MDSLEYIDSYFKGEFQPEETRQFEKRIQDDPLFAEEVGYYLSAYISSKEELAEEKKRNFREIYRRTVVPVKVRTMTFRRLFPALAAAAIIGAILLFWNPLINHQSAQKLADQYILKNLASLSLKMGVRDSMQTGIILYNEGKFPESLRQFERIFQADSSASTAILYAGLASLKMNQYDKALDYFKTLETRTNLQINPALFYEALTLMERNQAGDSSLAKQLLQEIIRKDLDKKEDAEQLLHKM